MMKYKILIVSLVVLNACQLPPSSIAPVSSLGGPPASSSSPTNSTSNPSTGPAETSTNKIALVYSGTGICAEDCASAAAYAATLAGFTPKLIVGNSLPETATADDVAAFFKDVAVWIEPGGYATNSLQGMTAKLQTSLVDFIKNGGGYVGFCAGAFMATTQIGTTGVAGLGIFPGNTTPFNGQETEAITWDGQLEQMYWEGGPYMTNYGSTVVPVAYYPDGTVAAARAQYGLGKVFLSGVHPEAPAWWSGKGSSSSVVGPDQSLAAEQMLWAGTR